jgi:hypothetical protein
MTVNNSVFKLLVKLIFAGMLFTDATAQDRPGNDLETLCKKPSGYLIGFFNGVWNTEAQAKMGAESLRILNPSLLTEKFNGEYVQIDLFYNATGSSHGASDFEDIAEVFLQRAEDFDEVFEGRWELFWDSLSRGGSSDSFLSLIAAAVDNISPAFSALLKTYYTELTLKADAALVSLMSSPPTEHDTYLQSARIKTHALENKKMLLVAHSQGNLFMNKAFDLASQLVPVGSVQAIHIAPASPTRRGEYVLADLDIVINSLHGFSGLTLPEITDSIPLKHLLSVDISGHKLVQTYLEPTLPMLQKLQRLATKALNELKTPNTGGTAGFFTVTLTWDGPGDVDLHVDEPDGSHVYYSSKYGRSGFLDFDNTVSKGPEHYYASCEKSKMQEGLYRVSIHNYANANGRLATVQVAGSAKGEMFSQVLDVGSGQRIPVVSVLISKNPTTGEFVSSIQRDSGMFAAVL